MHGPTSNENYFGKMPKVFCRVVKVDTEKRTLEAILERDGKRVALPIRSDAAIHRFGSWGKLSDFAPDARAYLLIDVDDKGTWLNVHAIADDVTYLALHNHWFTVKSIASDKVELTLEGKKPVSVALNLTPQTKVWKGEASRETPRLAVGDKVFYQSYFEGKRLTASDFYDEQNYLRAREQQERKHNELLAKDGAAAVVNDVQPFASEVLLTVHREGVTAALKLKTNDKAQLVRLENGKPSAPVPVTVGSVTPDHAKVKLRVVADGSKLSRLKIGDEWRVLIPSDVLLRNSLSPDYFAGKSLDERARRVMALLYCPCEIAGDNCTGQFYGVLACTHNCHMPTAMHKEIADLLKAGKSEEEVVKELTSRYGQALLLSHLLQ
jgi:cytochrome c-type biogenesis protein CcmH/NrfF